MAEYPLPNPSLPFGQQAISPVAQTNPLQSLTQGGVQGFSLGLQARQQAMLQEQQQRQAIEQQARMELAQKEERRKTFDDFTKSISTLHAMPESIRPQIWDNMVYPKAKELGINVSPGYDNLSDHPFTEKVIKVLDYHKKDPKNFPLDDTLGAIHLLSLTASEQGQQDTSKTLMDIAKEMQPKESPYSDQAEANRKTRETQFNVTEAGKFQAAVTGNEGVRKVMAINQQKLNNIGNAKALIDQVEQQPGGADQRQMFEVASATVKTLIGNNMLTEGEIKQMIPDTYKGNVNKFLEKVSNQPKGLEAQQFVNRFKDTLSREYDVTNKQMESARTELLGGYKKWAEDNPDYSTPILQAQGIYHPTLNPVPIQHENPFKTGNKIGRFTVETQ